MAGTASPDPPQHQHFRRVFLNRSPSPAGSRQEQHRYVPRGGGSDQVIRAQTRRRTQVMQSDWEHSQEAPEMGAGSSTSSGQD